MHRQNRFYWAWYNYVYKHCFRRLQIFLKTVWIKWALYRVYHTWCLTLTLPHTYSAPLKMKFITKANKQEITNSYQTTFTRPIYKLDNFVFCKFHKERWSCNTKALPKKFFRRLINFSPISYRVYTVYWRVTRPHPQACYNMCDR